MSVCYFDLETRYLVGEQGITWKTPEKMGVTVCCTRRDREYRDWFAEETAELYQFMMECDYVVGFNSHKFDLAVLQGELSDMFRSFHGLLSGKHVDLLLDIERHLGHRLSLDAIGQASFETAKAMAGKEAPLAWRQGRRLEVIEYCRYDVTLTGKIFNYWITRPEPNLAYKSKQGEMRMMQPVWHVRDGKGAIVDQVPAEVYHAEEKEIT